MRSSRSSGRSGSRTPRLSSATRSTASSISSSGFGVETLQSEPIASTAPAARSERNGYCQRHRSPRNGIVRLSIWPSWQAQYGCALAATPSSRKRPMSSGWMTWMWAMCGRVSDGPFCGSRRGHRVERLAHRPVADRVEVRLEPERIELRDPGREALGVDLAEAAVVGRAAVAVAVRLEHGAGEVLEDPVHHQLHARGLVAADRGRPAPLDELLDLLGAAMRAPTTSRRRRGRSARRGRPARRRRAPRSRGGRWRPARR